jgi:hypothetical protein
MKSIPHPATILSKEIALPSLPSALIPMDGDGCIPVMAVVRLSRITRMNLAPL